MVVKDGWLYIGGNFNQAETSSPITSRATTEPIFMRSAKSRPMDRHSAHNVSCIGQANDGIYVGGLFTAAGKTLANRIARWDGTNWNDCRRRNDGRH